MESFPIKSLLILYDKSRWNLYVNNFEGFKLLVNWLGPIESIKESEYIPVPECFRTYEMSELSKILGCSENYIFQVWRELWMKE